MNRNNFSRFELRKKKENGKLKILITFLSLLSFIISSSFVIKFPRLDLTKFFSNRIHIAYCIPFAPHCPRHKQYHRIININFP